MTSPNPKLSESYLQRFGGIARLYGNEALNAFSKAHMVIVGLGGVGTWAAEALARSGIGTLTLIELDDICITNTNRQVHALRENVGEAKLDVMAARLKSINPEIELHLVDDFLAIDNIQENIKKEHDVVLDCMDAAHIKAGLIAYCSALKIRLIVSGSSGGKQDPQQVVISDLGFTESDPMLAKIRGQLYRKYNFSRDKRRKFRIDAVYSTEQMVYPKPDGSVCMDKQVLKEGVKLDCAGGFGSSVMVTGSFGFTMANQALIRYLQRCGI